MLKDQPPHSRSFLENPYKIGDLVQFYLSYHKDAANKSIKTGRVTALMNLHCGVTPIGNTKELFFHFEELKRPETSKQQPLLETETCEE